jgi:uncharacterized protein
MEVVELFAFLHDVKRRNEGRDVQHGPRAAMFAQDINDTHLHLNAQRLALLADAIGRHSEGSTTGNITAQTCWDADRLDLRRMGIQVDPRRLCTKAARALCQT